MKHARWVFFSLVLGLWLTASVMAEPLRIVRAQAVLMPEGLPMQSREVALPHRWDRDFPGRDGSALYRLEVPAAPAGRVRALYLPRVGNQVEVLLDEQRIWGAGLLGDPRTDHAKAPVWITLPEDTARARPAAAVTVRISAQASRWGGMAAPWVGAEQEVRPLYQRHYAWRQYGGLAVCIAMGTMALLAAGLWWLQRDPLYSTYALAAAFGVLRFADRLIDNPPLPWPLWGAVAAMALVAHLFLMTRFLLMLVGMERRLDGAVYHGLLSLELALALAAFLLGIPTIWTVALGLMVIPSALALWAVAEAAWRQRTRQVWAVAIAGVLVSALGYRDLLVVRVSGDGAGTFSLLPHASMLFVLLLGWVVADRFTHTAREHRALLATLDARVREREAELAQRNAELRDEHAQQAALQERQRLMRDIHDGVGAQLVGLLSLLERDALPRELLREHAGSALDELRMAVDALQPVHGDLATVLATLRYRLQPRLEAAGIAVDWRVEELPPIEGLTPAVVLQLQRVLMEAFTNVIQHAGARRLRVLAQLDQGPPARLVLAVEDDGRGFDAARTARGQGLHNMRARAQAIGAQLEIGAGAEGGTAVRLALPAQA